jgi:hypothetical protein
MLDYDPLEFVVVNFLSLEEGLLACMDYIPFVSRNQQVVSPKFVSILMESCSLIDSVFQYMGDESKQHSLKQYSLLYEDRMDLDDATSLLMVSPLQFVRPLSNWTIVQSEWWAAHNKVKHDRLRNYETATYRSVVSALVALHQVIARSWIFLSILSRLGWFNGEDDEGLLELGAARSAGSGPPSLPLSRDLSSLLLETTLLREIRTEKRYRPIGSSACVSSSTYGNMRGGETGSEF